MLSKRVIALSADKAFAKRLAAGLNGAGASAEIHASLDELPKGEIKADLAVVHIIDDKDRTIEQLAPRLPADTRLVAVIPSSDLELMVKAMKSSPRVSAVLTADEFSPAALAAVTSRVLHGDVFGLEKLVPWGVRVYATLVGDYQEKSVAIAQVSDFASSMGVRRKYREAIEQCLDEMLMNALYDAPVDAAGKQMFADVPTKTRISLRMEQKAVVQYACEGSVFYLSVRDSFGALKGETVVKYLDKCLHSSQQIDRKAGGAGLGLYIITNATTQLNFNIYPGVATEAVCTFDLAAAKVQLKNFGIYQERIDSSGRLVGGPSKLIAGASATPVDGTVAAAPSNRALTTGLGVAIVLLLALIGIVAYPRLRGTPTGSIAVVTDPPGAAVSVDGVSKGPAPLTIDDLPVGQKVVVAARLAGHDDVSEVVTPARDGANVALHLRSRAPSLEIRTQPAGATVWLGKKELGATPLVLTDLEPGSEQELHLKKRGFKDLVEKVTVPAGGERSQVLFALALHPDFGVVRIESDPPGAQVLQNGELLAGMVTPVEEHIVTVGKPVEFTLKMPGHQPARVTRTVSGGKTETIAAKLVAGGSLSVETNVEDAKIAVIDVPACSASGKPLLDCPLPNGVYKVRVTSTRPYYGETLAVKIDGDDVKERLELGFVETRGPDLVLQIPGAPKNTRKAAFSDGTHTVKVVNSKTGAAVDRAVKIVAGRTVTVDAQ